MCTNPPRLLLATGILLALISSLRPSAIAQVPNDQVPDNQVPVSQAPVQQQAVKERTVEHAAGASPALSGGPSNSDPSNSDPPSSELPAGEPTNMRPLRRVLNLPADAKPTPIKIDDDSVELKLFQKAVRGDRSATSEQGILGDALQVIHQQESVISGSALDDIGLDSDSPIPSRGGPTVQIRCRVAERIVAIGTTSGKDFSR